MPCRGVGITPVLLHPVFLGETTRAVHVEQGVDRLQRLLAAYPPIALERARSA